MTFNILGIGSPAHFWLEIVKPNKINFEKTPTAREAYNYCSSLWHLIDWLKEDAKYNPQGQGMENFRKPFETQCPSLSIIHDIVTLTKHQKMSRSRGNLKKCEPDYGEVIFYAKTKSPMQSSNQTHPVNDFINTVLSGNVEDMVSEHPSSYTIELQDGSKTTLQKVVDDAYEFWERYFQVQRS